MTKNIVMGVPHLESFSAARRKSGVRRGRINRGSWWGDKERHIRGRITVHFNAVAVGVVGVVGANLRLRRRGRNSIGKLTRTCVTRGCKPCSATLSVFML